ncbi:MAG: hypothetical protein U0744_04835 [Gemmataceae bacterium]
MTIQATCPKGHKLKLDDKTAGKKIRCPRCQTSFVVPDADDEEDDRPRRSSRENDDDEDEDEDDRPRGKRRDEDDDDEDDDEEERKPKKKKAKTKSKADEFDDDDIREGEERLSPEERLKLRRKERKAQFGAVAFGLQMHFVKFMILLVAIAVAILSFILSLAIFGGLSLRPDQNAADFAVLGSLSIPVAMMALAQIAAVAVAPIVGIVGSFFCCFTPRGARTRVIIVASLVFDLVPIVAGIIRLLFNQVWNDIDPGKLDRLNYYLALGSFACMILGWLFFMVYLRDLGAYVGMPGVGNEALNLIAFLVVQVITAPINFIIDLYAFGLIANALDPTFGLIVVILLILGWGVSSYFFFLLGMIVLLTKIPRRRTKKDVIPPPSAR